MRVREKNQSLVKKFQEGAEGSIEKKISEIDLKNFLCETDLDFFVKGLAVFDLNVCIIRFIIRSEKLWK